MKHAIFFVALFAAAQASAQTFLISGQLDDGDAAADGVFGVDIDIVDADDNVVYSERQEGVVVVDGIFAIDVGAVTPIVQTFAVSDRVQLTIEGDALPALPLSFVLRAQRAHHADTAARAATATVVAGLAEDAAVTRDRLTTAGQSSVPFTALTGLDPTVRDGDNGQDLAVGANSGLTLIGRVLGLGAVPGSKLAANTVTSARIPPNAVTSVNIADGAITGAKITDGTLTASKLTADLTDREIATVPIFRIKVQNCEGFAVGDLVDTATCSPPSCTLGGGGLPLAAREGCNDPSSCDLFNPTTCANTAIGSLVVP